jgi:pilus assembly protein CpaF
MFVLDESTGHVNGAARRETREDRFQRLKQEIHKHLISAMNLTSVSAMDDYQLRHELRRGIEDLCRFRAELLSEAERERVVNEVIDETLGAGAD